MFIKWTDWAVVTKTFSHHPLDESVKYPVTSWKATAYQIVGNPAVLQKISELLLGKE
jgi:uncharacterized FAD-dependent dehydrogenase